MASGSRFSPALLAELRRTIAQSGIQRYGTNGELGAYVPPARIIPEWTALLGRALPAKPLALALDVYGTLLSSTTGEIGPGATWYGPEEPTESPGRTGGAGAFFPHDMKARLDDLVALEHERKRAEGIPWPEVDAPALFATALDLDPDNGARACVAWECMANACSPMLGAKLFIENCAGAGLPLGIVSNAQFYTPMFIEEAFDAQLLASPAVFDPALTFWSYETGRAKPDPWMFRELVRVLAGRGIPAGRILYVGNDALNDCAAAGEAGLMTALFCGDGRSARFRPGDARVAANPPDTLALSWDEVWRLVCT